MLTADKCNVTVVMDTAKYANKMHDILKDKVYKNQT